MKNDDEEDGEYGSEYDSEEDNDEKTTYKSMPKVCSSSEAAKHLVGKKMVVVLTGAGVGAVSGVKTYLGPDDRMR